ncbi:MAG: TonB-dependent receptor plug domain-containing protein [Polyangiales bacterium]
MLAPTSRAVAQGDAVADGGVPLPSLLVPPPPPPPPPEAAAPDVPPTIAPPPPPPPVEVAPAPANEVPIDVGPATLGGESVPGAVEVTVRTRKNEGQRLQESAEAVNVIDTKRARQQTADLGEVLARTQGVGIRRTGGLGSDATISLNGLEGDQIRLFIDGVPLALAGFPFGIVNIPVNLVDRMEVYRGVVPIRFGADALGGAINVVTDQRYETRLDASYQVGSFGTHRATADGRYRHDPSGFVFAASAYLDWTRNDYVISDRSFAAPDGSSVVRDVKRWHDAYHAGGGSVELGVVDRTWAKRLTIQGFASTFDKEVQHNGNMTLPFGGITGGETVYGATARHEVELPRGFALSTVVSYAHRIIDFEDLSTTKFDWAGRRGLPVGRPLADGSPARGELGGAAADQSLYEDGIYARTQLSYTPTEGQTVRVAVTPQFTTRTGESHLPTAGFDRLSLRNKVLALVSGIEYELSLFDDRLSNLVFGKSYFMNVTAEDNMRGVTFERTRKDAYWGGGDAVRLRFSRWLLGKASYEYAARIPRPDELFGNGVLIIANDELKPEVSHNVNVGPRLETKRTRFGDFMLDVNGFMRDSRDLILLLAGRQQYPYTNLGRAKGFGIENAASWSAPGRWVGLDGTFSYQDVRNRAEKGAFATQNGQRIPSRAYMFASWSGRVRIPNLPRIEDALEPFYIGRWTHGYYTGWALGTADSRQRVPNQISHNVGVTYTLVRDLGRVGATFEVSNVSDAELYDVFGVQRPGRAYYLKLTGHL